MLSCLEIKWHIWFIESYIYFSEIMYAYEQVMYASSSKLNDLLLHILYCALLKHFNEICLLL